MSSKALGRIVIGVFIASLVGVVLFYGTIAYVVGQFISKVW
jgi:hypothetical protein